MKVSIVIPNYNGRELLEKNLPQVLKVKGVEEVIVVDDGSTDESRDYLRNQGINLKIIENRKNLGFASAVNRGVKEAEGEIMILLNTDVRPEKDFLKSLLVHFRNPEVFAVGCLDKSIERGKIVFRGRGLGKFQKGFLVHRRGEVDKTDTLWVSGGSGAFKRSTFLKLGGFDKLYNPFYWEDIDLSYRALKSGYKILFEPKSEVIHYHEEGIIKRNYPPSHIKIIAYRNQFIFVWKNITDLKLQFSHLLWIPYHFTWAILRGDLYFLIGFFLAILKLPSIIRSSFMAQKMFKISDQELLGRYEIINHHSGLQ